MRFSCSRCFLTEQKKQFPVLPLLPSEGAVEHLLWLLLCRAGTSVRSCLALLPVTPLPSSRSSLSDLCHTQALVVGNPRVKAIYFPKV